MDHFNYKKGILYAEDVPVTKIAEQAGTPFYCYSTATLQRHYKVFTGAFSAIPTTICFAVKANSNLAVLKTLAQLGSGADTVSEGEIRRALAVGIPPEKIVFSGVGKSRDEMKYALSQEIGQFNVESAEELEMINDVAGSIGKKAKIAIRVNPDIDAGTHHKISTGRKIDKFGVAFEQARGVYSRAKELVNIEVVGITTHIGSQITKLDPFKKAFDKIGVLIEDLRADGHDIKRIDLGGGLGIPYDNEAPPHPDEYAAMIIDTIRHLGCELVLEPGRLICGNAGILVSKVILVKSAGRKFVVIDAAMNDLIRPSMYDAYHEIISVKEPDGKDDTVDIVGPVCETGDVFGRDRKLKKVKEGDLVAIRSAGAYGAVMAGTYNSRLLVPEIMVNGDRFSIVRERQTYENMLSQDRIPDWF